MPNTKYQKSMMREKRMAEDLNELNWKLSINSCDLFAWHFFTRAYMYASCWMRFSMLAKMNITCSRSVLQNQKKKQQKYEKQSENEKKWTLKTNSEARPMLVLAIYK